MQRTLAIGSDHSGFDLKTRLIRAIREDLGLTVLDCGCAGLDPVDYPDVAIAVGRALQEGRATEGIMIDGAGVGSTMVLNRLSGVRAALCHDPFTAKNSRAHNDANALVLGSLVVHPGEALRLVRIWLGTEFEGGRHARRVDKIKALDHGGPK